MQKYCTNCGEQVVSSAKFCGNCGNLFSHRTEEIVTNLEGRISDSTEVIYKNRVEIKKGNYFFRRFGANIIDNFIFLVLFLIIQTGLEDYSSNFLASDSVIMFWIIILILLVTVGPLVYFTLMECSVYQGTFGKKVMGLKVVNVNGEGIGFGRALGRNLGKILSNILLVGYIIILFTEGNKGLHDYVSGSEVIYK